ncbi:hypothetical protein QUF80_22200 [Desulfococcaceae bacterium HSG8]|nr:hypothetical protein [Desulfococcaceae bacterium HSG8]
MFPNSGLGTQALGDFQKRIYPGRFVVPPSGGVTPPEGGTTNLSQKIRFENALAGKLCLQKNKIRLAAFLIC